MEKLEVKYCYLDESQNDWQQKKCGDPFNFNPNDTFIGCGRQCEDPETVSPTITSMLSQKMYREKKREPPKWR